MKGTRIGTMIPVTMLRYCVDDNTYDEVIVQRPAMACPLDWQPMQVNYGGNISDELYPGFGF